MSENSERKALWIRFGEWYYDFKERHTVLLPVKRKTYCWLCLLGIIGAHHFYAKHWIKGLVYLAFCWTGIPGVMGLIDWMIAVPKEPDENGMILI
ncbi:MAG: TM2 domain-containing protein [Lachnospiraceae bacterium]|nr:TM2 domain-containing protein [Lachnospiraceae bacterium]